LNLGSLILLCTERPAEMEALDPPARSTARLPPQRHWIEERIGAAQRPAPRDLVWEPRLLWWFDWPLHKTFVADSTQAWQWQPASVQQDRRQRRFSRFGEESRKSFPA